ncbi:ABC transporter ATP-binding protein [Paenibacillus sp. ACRRX]|uniref:ABC transporter ATP-binding protein n=1 Tax=unclassified Paenibacillus TaxID=185978 RepID=UPI001EF5BA84|nr:MULTISPECIES: ABC transporter ATP-binding protein [unclassified Paenibacillus]MCG7410706.1 ABC transporter ATP-binding protein [Paenibacillus sp. ACRRX]MDK8184031.1 ABC transporter ATP-binding protein [Paenibacillus sp. UMB4589-SE434]
MTYAIECTKLSKQYGSFHAVNDINLCFNQGQISALLGPNGAGKTTTISMILGLQKPTSGSISVLGMPAGTKEIRQRIGALMQDVKAADGLTVKEVLELFRSYYRNPLSLARLLDLSGLHQEAKRRASALSGGQRRRLAFAQSLAGNPELILLDEPTVGMDIEARGRFWDTIRTLAADGRTVVLTTHDLTEADAVADHIAIIAAGRIAAEGTPAQLKAQSALRSISFRSGSSLSDAQLMQLPGIVKFERRADKIHLYAEETDTLVGTLLQADWGIYDLEVQSAKLEEAFRIITNQQ